MKKTDFSKNAPGKLVTTIQGYLAYVPNPLPPRINWTDSLVAALSRADRSLAQLAEAGKAFPAPHVMVRPFIRKEAVLSSRIEGTRTSFQGLLAFEARQMRLFEDFEDAHEVQNYVQAMDYGLERLKTLPVSMRLLREIHGILMKEVRGEQMAPGELRRSQNWIGKPGATIENATYVPPPVEAMKRCLADLERFIHTDPSLPGLLRIALTHYQFEAIHPFLDGNGRMGRLLVTLLMVSWGLLPQPLLYLSSYLESKHQAYYDRLLAVSQKADWEGWLQFFLEGVQGQALDAIARINRLQALRQAILVQLDGERNRSKLARLVDYLIGTPITTISQAQAQLGMGSYTTIQRHMERLAALGILREATGRGRNRIYRAESILEVLEMDLA